MRLSTLLAVLLFCLPPFVQASNYKWARMIDGNAKNDIIFKSTADASGNIYVTGRSENLTQCDLFTAKYNSAGIRQWISTYSGGTDAEGYDIVVKGPYVYVTGYSKTSTTVGFDVIVEKYYIQNGTVVSGFPVIYNSSGSQNDYGKNIMVGTGTDTAIYVVGTCNRTGSQMDWLLMKISKTGTVQTATIYDYNGANGIETVGKAISDASDNIYVTGTTNAGTDAEVITGKWSSSLGAPVWVTKYTNTGDDHAYGIALDGSGNVYAAGDVNTASNGADVALFKYNSSGTLQNGGAPFTYDGTDHKPDAAMALAVKGSYAYICGFVGRTASNGYGGDVLTMKYNLSGTLQWASSYGGARTTIWDAGLDFVIDNSDNVYTAGVSGYENNFSNQGEYDAILLKYDSSGTQQSVDIWDGPYGGARDSVCSVTAINSGSNVNLIMTGYASVDQDGAQRKDAMILNYDLGTGSFSFATFARRPNIEGGVLPDSPDLNQNYPNPFNPVTTIRYHLDKAEKVTLKIFDVLGKEVAAPVIGQDQNGGDHEVVFDASRYGSGTYFYQLQVGNTYLPTRKMSFVK